VLCARVEETATAEVASRHFTAAFQEMLTGAARLNPGGKLDPLRRGVHRAMDNKLCQWTVDERLRCKGRDAAS
jgi:hypothetical protein